MSIESPESFIPTRIQLISQMLRVHQQSLDPEQKSKSPEGNSGLRITSLVQAVALEEQVLFLKGEFPENLREELKRTVFNYLNDPKYEKDKKAAYKDIPYDYKIERWANAIIENDYLVEMPLFPIPNQSLE
ncbi:MAG TPA: hypothetical protein VLF89_08330 [Candidatus Saccharimonadales bacterium]|nr:hypothetical protein [Candidatus Saccharimonadales bacterium]